MAVPMKGTHIFNKMRLILRPWENTSKTAKKVGRWAEGGEPRGHRGAQLGVPVVPFGGRKYPPAEKYIWS